jgi:hypothetical protein
MSESSSPTRMRQPREASRTIPSGETIGISATAFVAHAWSSARRRRAPERAHPQVRKRGAPAATPRSAAKARQPLKAPRPRSVHVAGETTDRAGRDIRVGIDDQVGGAAVGAAEESAGGRGTTAHAAHRHRTTGHRRGGGSSHHGFCYWFFLARSIRWRSLRTRGTAAVAGPLIGRLGVGSRSGLMGS